MSAFDPRLTPARPDLAAAHLKGKVEAARFVDGVRKRVIAPKAPLCRLPSHGSMLDTEALHGETLTVYETTDEGWCWGQLDLDGYVGWLPNSALGEESPEPTHRVSVLRTLVFPGPDIKQPPLFACSFGCHVFVSEMKGTFALIKIGGLVPRQGFIHASHLEPFAVRETDFVGVAERFVGTPYLWGGRSSLGLDCSGLVQVALQSTGIQCPRDSDMQERIGAPVSFSGDPAGLNRGDLVFWKGHVGVVSGPDRLLHANAFHMAVAEEQLSGAIERIRKSGLEVTGVRRVV